MYSQGPSFSQQPPPGNLGNRWWRCPCYQLLKHYMRSQGECKFDHCTGGMWCGLAFSCATPSFIIVHVMQSDLLDTYPSNSEVTLCS